MSTEALTREVSLWETLHDGSFESLISDALARTVTILVDVPYIWEFHNLPNETRFKCVLQSVHLVEALQFAPWPGEFVIPEGLSWEESQKLRYANYAKGRLESADWRALAAKLESTTRYEISNSIVTYPVTGGLVFQIELADYTANDYPQLRVTADTINFYLDADRELSLEEFRALGEAYWKAFEERRTGTHVNSVS